MASVEMEYVYLVYQEKSFSKAAQKLFVSQSAVSAMVRKAEAKIGCQIFDRSTIPPYRDERGGVLYQMRGTVYAS